MATANVSDVQYNLYHTYTLFRQVVSKWDSEIMDKQADFPLVFF